MSIHRRSPRYRIWVPGIPASGTKRAKALSRYRQSIASTAAALVQTPLRSQRLDLEIWFVSRGISRADVDNVLKPILDSLKGIVYLDDRQVRSVKVVALPGNDAFTLNGLVSAEIIHRLVHGQPEHPEFMVDVYVGLALPAPGV